MGAFTIPSSSLFYDETTLKEIKFFLYCFAVSSDQELHTECSCSASIVCARVQFESAWVNLADTLHTLVDLNDLSSCPSVAEGWKLWERLACPMYLMFLRAGTTLLLFSGLLETVSIASQTGDTSLHCSTPGLV